MENAVESITASFFESASSYVIVSYRLASGLRMGSAVYTPFTLVALRTASASISRARSTAVVFVVKKGLAQAQNFNMTQLEAAHQRLVETDWAIKTGGMEDVLALDTLVVALTGAS